jgi:hypothetical protein
MNKTYVIQWKSRVNGRMGRGTKVFDREEANRLVQELNREYPQIDHEVLDTANLEGPKSQPTRADSEESQETDSGTRLTALAA